MELVLEQQGSCRAEGGGGLEGPGWSSREAAVERAAAGAAEGLRRRGSALVCSVCTVDSNADIDAGWRLRRRNLGFDHMDHDTRTHKCAHSVVLGLGLGLDLDLFLSDRSGKSNLGLGLWVRVRQVGAQPWVCSEERARPCGGHRARHIEGRVPGDDERNMSE